MIRKIGGITKNESEKNISYGIRYYVTEDALDAFVPEINSAASWAGDDFVVSSYELNKEGYGWIVSISAIPAEDGFLTYSSEDKSNIVMKNFRPVILGPQESRL